MQTCLGMTCLGMSRPSYLGDGCDKPLDSQWASSQPSTSSRDDYADIPGDACADLLRNYLPRDE